MAKPLVSIIIPVFKGEKLLAQTIESALAQRYSNFELIIVNDGSPDQSKLVVEKYLTDPRIRYIEQVNAGVANARNTGIMEAKGQLIALLDQDDIWLPEKLRLQVDYLTQHPECALVHTQIQFIDAANTILPTPEWAWVAETVGNSLELLFQHNRIATFTALIRKSALDNSGLFRERFAPSDDWDLWLRIARKYELGFIPDVCGYYRLHPGNESKNQQRMQLAEVSVIENFIQEFKGYQQMLSPSVQRKKCFQIYCETALFFEQNNQYITAADFWLNALKQNPFSAKCYSRLFWAQLPTQLRSVLHWYFYRFIGLFH